jgi:Xaa-Pro aminopeptidase
MKKNVTLLFLIALIFGCNSPVGRSWVIPLTIDPSDLIYTASHMERFESRRKQLTDSISDGYIILRSSGQSSYNRHEFRPNNNYYYLTGFSAPRSYLLLSAESEYPFTLTLPPQSIRSVIYEGGHLPEDEIKTLYGPHRLLSYHQFWVFIDSLVQTGTSIYLDRTNRQFYEEVGKKAGKTGISNIKDVSGLLDEMRVLKEPMEVERLQKACNITAKALTNVMKECAAGQFEFEMESIIEGTFLEYGSAMPGFNSIVGSGPNSTTLHYEPNTRMMEDGDLLLMDIGAEYGFYTADISRTIPVNGKFSEEQRAIYQLVLDAQQAAIEKMIPGNEFLDGQLAARKVITEGLSQLGLITDPDAKWQSGFYTIHGISHYLGLDVHDVGKTGLTRSSYRNNSSIPRAVESRALEPGMVLTIEPGVYIREQGLDQIHEMYESEVDSLEIAAFVDAVQSEFEKYIHIGVRIEDDILITEDGNINLSRYAPKEIEDIQQLMR